MWHFHLQLQVPNGWETVRGRQESHPHLQLFLLQEIDAARVWLQCHKSRAVSHWEAPQQSQEMDKECGPFWERFYCHSHQWKVNILFVPFCTITNPTGSLIFFSWMYLPDFKILTISIPIFSTFYYPSMLQFSLKHCDGQILLKLVAFSTFLAKCTQFWHFGLRWKPTQPKFLKHTQKGEHMYVYNHMVSTSSRT